MRPHAKFQRKNRMNLYKKPESKPVFKLPPDKTQKLAQ